MNKMKILLAAEEAAGKQTMRLLSGSEHELAGVLTNLNSVNKSTSVAFAAKSMNIPVMDAKLVKNPGFAEWIVSNNIDVLLNVHSLYVICPEVIQSVRVGAFNLHPGPLPEYSGLNAPSWAVYNEETEHAVTFHRIANSVDAGNIIYKTAFPISLSDTGLTVSIKCVQEGLLLIERFLEDLKCAPLSFQESTQDLAQRRFYLRNQVPGNGWINWSNPAKKIDAFVRACNYAPFPSAWGNPKTRLGDIELSILKTAVSNETSNEAPGTIGFLTQGKAAIAASDKWILVKHCMVEGKLVEAGSLLKPGDVLT